jgi:hypothetical protein
MPALRGRGAWGARRTMRMPALRGRGAAGASLALLLALVLGTAPPAAARQQAGRPNILFLFSDDHAAHALSAYRAHLRYGAPLPDTPNLDRLAADGMLFSNAFVTNSICGPSRATVLTGQYGHLNGVMTNEQPLHPDHTTFPGLLQAAGYETALFGKWHLRTNPVGFDRFEILAGQGPYYNPVLHNGRDSVHHTGYTTDVITARALDWLGTRRDASRPFLLMLHYNAAHRFWDPGPAELPLFRDTLFTEPATLRDDGAGRTSAFRLQEMELAHDLFPRDLKLEAPPGLTPEQLARWNRFYAPENDALAAAGLTGDALLSWKY